MFLKYKDEQYTYDKALEIKHPKPVPVAKKHNLRQTEINMKFDTVDDVAGFVDAVFDNDREKVFINEPNFLNPRSASGTRKDYSQGCSIM